MAFARIERLGGRVQRARSYRHDGGCDYSPRNVAGSLACVQSEADYLVVCDPDMIFFQPLPMENYDLDEHQVSFDQVSYLFVNDENTSLLQDACDRAGLSVDTLRQLPVSGGVPHIVPAALRETLSQHWLLSMEFFALDAPPSVGGGSRLPWLASMWSLVLAVRMLELEPVLTHFCMSNYDADREFPSSEKPVMLHYCYGDSQFDKRRYVDAIDANERVWQVESSERTD